jgi:hypothetical protein
VDTGEWIVVSVAVVLAGGTFGVLLNRPLWLGGSRPGLVSAMLSVHAGLAAVIGVVTASAAARSWQLIGRPLTENAAGLLDVSRTDGDGSMYALLVMALAFATGLTVTALALGARFADGDDPAERIVACAVLAFELCIGGYGAARVLDGNAGVVAVLLTLHLPVLMYAMVRCWPPVEPVDPA